MTVTRRWAGQGDGSSPQHGGGGVGGGDIAVSPNAPLSAAAPPARAFNTAGSARPGRCVHIQLVPVRLILSKAVLFLFFWGWGGFILASPTSPTLTLALGLLFLGGEGGKVYYCWLQSIHTHARTHTKLG